mgnify:CR=1 FL=1
MVSSIAVITAGLKPFFFWTSLVTMFARAEAPMPNITVPSRLECLARSSITS